MNPDQIDQIYESSFAVLDRTRVNGLPVPALGHFEDWVFDWDTATIAEAESYRNPERAAGYILFYNRYQHQDGLVPNRVSVKYKNGPDGLDRATSRITQPPLRIDAALQIGKRLPTHEVRQDFYRDVFGPFKKYARFLLTDRFGEDGLITNLHGYEVGMDDTPPWGESMHDNWQKEPAALQRLTRFGEAVVNGGRRRFTDGRTLALEHRATDLNVLLNWFQSMRLARAGYNLERAMADPKIVLLKDIGFNAIAAGAFTSLQEIAEEIDDPAYQLGGELEDKIQQHHQAIHEELWSARDQAYYSKNARTGELIPIQTIASLFPLLAEPPQERKEKLVDDLFDKDKFNAGTGAVPFDSPHYEPGAYWRGGDWPLAAMPVHKGLDASGFPDERCILEKKALERPFRNIKGEFDHPETGEPLGAPGFGARAAVDIISIQHLKQQ
jgi:hypothetical protein